MCDCMRIISRTRENLFIGYSLLLLMCMFCCCCCCVVAAAVQLSSCTKHAPKLERSALICTILDTMACNLTVHAKETHRTLRKEVDDEVDCAETAPQKYKWINHGIVANFSTRLVKWNASKSCLFVKHFNQCSGIVDFFSCDFTTTNIIWIYD